MNRADSSPAFGFCQTSLKLKTPTTCRTCKAPFLRTTAVQKDCPTCIKARRSPGKLPRL